MTTTIVAFSDENVRQITGWTTRQLRYWDRAGYFPPRNTDADPRVPRIYDFRSVVGLRTLALLRYKYNASPRSLQDVGKWLARQHASSWADLRLFISAGRVSFDTPQSGDGLATPLGRTVFPIALGAIEQETAAAAEKLKARTPEQIGTVARHRGVLGNAPVLAGTRIPTSTIWHWHEDGYDTAAILAAYPSLTEHDVDAAIAYERVCSGVA